MKYIVILLMIVSSSAFAGLNEIEQKLKATPQMTARCDAQIKYLSGKVTKYQNLVDIKRNVVLNKLKLHHFKAELENWKGYCVDPDNLVTHGLPAKAEDATGPANPQ